MRFFNTEGPVRAELHYTIPPLSRIDLAEVEWLIEAQNYLLVHAPRQMGRTSCLIALTKLLNERGTYRAVYANIESAQALSRSSP